MGDYSDFYNTNRPNGENKISIAMRKKAFFDGMSWALVYGSSYNKDSIWEMYEKKKLETKKVGKQ